jgi:ferredoxin-NADP reductase
VHLTLYIAILLVFFHQINTGGDLIKDDWFRYYWLGLYVLAFGVLSYFRVFRIGLWYIKYGFSVEKVVQEADGIYSVYITGRDIEKFQFEPGQYAGWRVLNRRWWWQSHPYSFSGRPGDGSLRYTINTADGNFTRTVPSLATGTKLLIDGPRGSFTAERVGSSKRVVLIAGGVGITPFISLIPKLLEAELDVSLLYAARTPAHVAFRKEIAGFQAKGLRFQEYISAPKAGSPGQIDAKVLKPYCDGATTFYICGPPPMVATLRKTLRALGVANDHVVTERFNV